MIHMDSEMQKKLHQTLKPVVRNLVHRMVTEAGIELKRLRISDTAITFGTPIRLPSAIPGISVRAEVKAQVRDPKQNVFVVCVVHSQEAAWVPSMLLFEVGRTTQRELGCEKNRIHPPHPIEDQDILRFISQVAS